MSDNELHAQIAAAQVYEEFFVPALIKELAAVMIDAAHIRPGDKVLDIACGTGIAARIAAQRVGSSGRVVGLDRNPGMLEVARRITTGIEWRKGNAESLPYTDETFDAVVCQFGLMFFTDRPIALREMMRVLMNNGRLALTVWDRLENIPALAVEAEVVERIAGPSAGDDLRAPFILGDRDKLTALLASVGLESASISTQRGKAHFPSVGSLLEADIKGFLPLGGIQLTEDQILKILSEGEQALSPYVTPKGTLEFDASIHIITATKRGAGIN
jgi:SAM-dependent methyltransferase